MGQRPENDWCKLAAEIASTADPMAKGGLPGVELRRSQYRRPGMSHSRSKTMVACLSRVMLSAAGQNQERILLRFCYGHMGGRAGIRTLEVSCVPACATP